MARLQCSIKSLIALSLIAAVVEVGGTQECFNYYLIEPAAILAEEVPGCNILGSTVQIKCRIQQPDIINIAWYFTTNIQSAGSTGVQIDSSRAHSQRITSSQSVTSTLTIADFNGSDTGYYWCSADEVSHSGPGTLYLHPSQVLYFDAPSSIDTLGSCSDQSYTFVFQSEEQTNPSRCAVANYVHDPPEIFEAILRCFNYFLFEPAPISEVLQCNILGSVVEMNCSIKLHGQDFGINWFFTTDSQQAGSMSTSPISHSLATTNERLTAQSAVNSILTITNFGENNIGYYWCSARETGTSSQPTISPLLFHSSQVIHIYSPTSIVNLASCNRTFVFGIEVEQNSNCAVSRYPIEPRPVVSGFTYNVTIPFPNTTIPMIPSTSATMNSTEFMNNITATTNSSQVEPTPFTEPPEITTTAPTEPSTSPPNPELDAVVIALIWSAVAVVIIFVIALCCLFTIILLTKCACCGG